MHKVFITLGLLACIVLAGCAAPTRDYRVVGYISDTEHTDRIDASRIDTLIYAFAQVDHDAVVLLPYAADSLAKVVALKKANPSLRVVISVGGWTADGFSQAASSVEGRQRFASSAAKLLADHYADGLDIDWEYPGHGESGIASSPADRVNFPLLLAATRKALDALPGHHTLSAAVADGAFVDGVDIPAANRYLDWFNLMTYDFNNSLTPTTGHHSGLHPSALAPADARTGDRAVAQFLAAGVPASKLFIGVAFYGRQFNGVKPEANGVYQRYGKYGTEIPWPELKAKYIDKNGFKRYWDADAQAPYVWNASTGTFISYDDPQSIAAKVAFVRKMHLGGVMYWEQSLDTDGDLLRAVAGDKAR
ncbi:glycoside hydrolase family 18 protein [Pinirhizobacter soli]|uniref:glycoside hydrolase family 18 protein n=1 Tax=Pinirhizobacter soli TaxID=2786953 RepID=UPI00202A9517|nr:glycoside hydrolase family 18 protein [Pinirhizobacter soli]